MRFHSPLVIAVYSVFVSVCTSSSTGTTHSAESVGLGSAGWNIRSKQVGVGSSSISKTSDSVGNSWTTLFPSLPDPSLNSFSSVVTSNSTVIVFSGYSFNEVDIQDSTWVLDVSPKAVINPENNWRTAESIRVGRSDGVATKAPLLGDEIFLVIGGDNGTYSENGVQYTTVTNSIEVFDAKTGSFVTDDLDVPSYPLALMGIGAAFLPTGEVVGVGGFGYESNGAFFYTQNTYLLKDDVNSEGSGTWERVEDFPWARSGLACSSISTGILCFGGGNTEPAYSNAAIFNGTNWNIISPLNEARNWAGATTAMTRDEQGGLKETVYAVGGYCCSNTCFFSPLASVEKYDIQTDTWIECTELPQKAAGGGAVTAMLFKGGDSDSEGSEGSRLIAVSGNMDGASYGALNL